MGRPGPDDAGTVLVLVLGMAVVLLALVVVVVDVSAVVLARRGAASTADGAAVAGAQQLDEATFYARGLSERVPLDPALVAATAGQYAAEAQDAQPGLQLVGGVDATGQVAVVQAARTVRLPLVGWLGISQVTVHAVARARSPLLP